GALVAAPALGRRAGRPAAVALAVVGVATLGAALWPLGVVRGGRQDMLHLAFGATGYVSLSLLPLLGGLGRGGRERLASYALGAVTSACLLGTVPAEAVSGGLQRTGFAAAHLWLLAELWGVLRRPGR
ncbi:MAG: hypothetical protein JWN08_3415, partial [Frankiales bacterium]|nr:hypothetical protein [Frankiales bacterium]